MHESFYNTGTKIITFEESPQHDNVSYMDRKRCPNSRHSVGKLSQLRQYSTNIGTVFTSKAGSQEAIQSVKKYRQNFSKSNKARIDSNMNNSYGQDHIERDSKLYTSVPITPNAEYSNFDPLRLIGSRNSNYKFDGSVRNSNHSKQMMKSLSNFGSFNVLSSDEKRRILFSRGGMQNRGAFLSDQEEAGIRQCLSVSKASIISPKQLDNECMQKYDRKAFKCKWIFD